MNTTTTQEGIELFSYPPNQETVAPPAELVEPAKLVVLTSLRDIFHDDRVGQTIRLHGIDVYMMGFVEALVHVLADERPKLIRWLRQVEDLNGGILDTTEFDALQRRILTVGQELRSRMQLVGVINDDIEHDRERLQAPELPIIPNTNRWIHSLDLRDSRGELITANTANIQSGYRALPRSRQEERALGKTDFEQRLHQVAVEQMGADVLLSDHLMVILKDLLTPEYGLSGRLVNLHPAITDRLDPDCFRGETPTKDAIRKSGQVDPATGENYQVRTGATFHFIDSGIDTGNPIARTKRTPVRPTDTPEELRFRNYPRKVLVGLEGLLHYLNTLYAGQRLSTFNSVTTSSHVLPTQSATI